MVCYSAWQFTREHAVLAGTFLSGLLVLGLSLLLHRLRRTKGRRKKLLTLAACWRAVLFEHSLALDCMQQTARHLIRDRQQLPALERAQKSDILLHRWLREGFMQRASDKEGARLVGFLNHELHLFIRTVNRATDTRLRMHGLTSANHLNRSDLQKSTDDFVDKAIRLACNRHHGMVEAWKQSYALLGVFCARHDLNGENALLTPCDIPSEWQMDETMPWTVTDLAPVGEEKWHL